MTSAIESRDRIKYTDYLGSSQQGKNCFLNQPVLYKPWNRELVVQKCTKDLISPTELSSMYGVSIRTIQMWVTSSGAKLPLKYKKKIVKVKKVKLDPCTKKRPSLSLGDVLPKERAPEELMSPETLLPENGSGPDKDTKYKKPYMSFAQLIAEALNNAPEQTLVLSDIYKAINAKYPYYKLETRGWQNSIRHNLTLNENFIKKGKKWELSKDVPKLLLERKHKYLKYRRKTSESSEINRLKNNRFCIRCDQKFSSKQDLIQHIENIHDGEDMLKEFAKNPQKRPSLSLSVSLHCPMCRFETSRKNCLDAHIKSHISCEQCGVVFPGKRQLAVHLTTHKQKKKNVCMFCNREFNDKSNKWRHEKICKKRPEGVKLLGQEGNKPFKCNECEKAFFTKQYMKVHKKKFHNQNDAF